MSRTNDAREVPNISAPQHSVHLSQTARPPELTTAIYSKKDVQPPTKKLPECTRNQRSGSMTSKASASGSNEANSCSDVSSPRSLRKAVTSSSPFRAALPAVSRRTRAGRNVQQHNRRAQMHLILLPRLCLTTRLSSERVQGAGGRERPAFLPALKGPRWS